MLRIFLLLLGAVVLINGNARNVCLICSCYLTEPGKYDSTNLTRDGSYLYAGGETGITTGDKFLYVNCSSEGILFDMDNVYWPQLEILEVHGNFDKSQWKSVPNFQNFFKEKAVELSLVGNFLQNVQFEKFPRLKTLNLSRNLIPEVDETSFKFLSNLKKLDLSKNLITKVKDYTFIHMNLEFLNLSGNRLSQLDFNTFKNADSLQVLDLSNNNLKALPNEFHLQAFALRNLSLSQNNFDKVPNIPFELQKLDISRNNLTKINLEMGVLEVLDVSYNRLVELSVHASALKVLKARNNHISTLEKFAFQNLRILDLSYNLFETVPEVINSDAVPKLAEVYLGGNPISRIQFALRALPFSDLLVVDFSYTDKLVKIQQDAFNGIFHASAPNIPGVSINMSHCKISQIEDGVFKNVYINNIDLSFNHLETLSARLLDWTSVSFINLQNNPWICDCKIQWMLEDLVPFLYVQNPRLLFDLRCSLPERLANKLFVYWYKAKTKIFCDGPSAVYFHSPIGEKTYEMWTGSFIVCIVLSIIIVILLIAILVVVCMKPRLQCRLRRTKDKRRKINYTSVLLEKDLDDLKYG